MNSVNLKSVQGRRMDPHRARRRRLAVDQGTTGTQRAVASPVSSSAPERDWSELPVDALSSVFAKLGAVEILMGAGLVCRSWLDAAGMPELWRSVDMASHKLVGAMDTEALRAMAKVAVGRSGGQLQVFVGKRFVDDELLKYIGERASSLKTLRLISCNDVSNQGLADAATKFPLLNELELSLCSNVDDQSAFEAIGNSCPKLTRFRRSENRVCRHGYSTSYKNRVAMGIATMAELRSLQLVGNSLTNAGLAAILDGCPLLETLDVRHCYNVRVDDDDALRAKCGGLKTLRLPAEDLIRDDDCEFQDQVPGCWCWPPSWSPPYVIDLISDDDDDYGN